MAREFTFEGKRYRMVPWNTEIVLEVCLTCPFYSRCSSSEELLNLKGGPCTNEHPVEIPMLVVIQEPAAFRNGSEQEDWQQVLTIAKAWGWIQD